MSIVKDVCLTLAGGGIAAIAAYINGYVTYRRLAAADLRAAFAPEIAFMRQDNIEDAVIQDKLTNAFDRHSIAVEKYRFFVRSGRRAAYDQTWKTYYTQGGQINFMQYASHASDESRDASKQKWHKQIELLLSFTSNW